MDDYPGAVAAYSLRLLNTDFTGDAIVVRRSSDNATQSIGFVDGELDTAALDTFCSGTDGFVATWFDQSGNGNDAVQTTASSQPKIFDSATGVVLQNNKPSMYFTNSQLQYTGLSIPIPYTGITNIKYEAINLFDYALSFGTSVFLGIGNTLNFSLFAQVYLTNGAANTNPNLLFGVVNGGNSAFSVNSNLITGNAGAIGTSGISIGGLYQGGGNFNGYVNETIVYPNDQSSNRTGIEDNINNHYSIY